jgi:hypothetical protein
MKCKWGVQMHGQHNAYEMFVGALSMAAFDMHVTLQQLRTLTKLMLCEISEAPGVQVSLQAMQKQQHRSMPMLAF